MAKAKRGDRVRLHYTGRLADGREFDSTEHAGDGQWNDFRGRGVAFAPMELVIGQGKLFPACEEALVGLEPGQSAIVTLPAAQAYGPYIPELVRVVALDDFSPGEEAHAQTFRVAEGRRRPNMFKPKVGKIIEVQTPDGAIRPARIRAMDEDTITLDANHPLAGQDLTYELRLVELVT